MRRTNPRLNRSILPTTPIAFALCLFAIPGCVSRNSNRMPRRPAMETPGFSDSAAAAMEGMSSQSPIRLASAGDDLSNVPLDRRIVIYNAAFRVVVAEVVDAIKKTEALADELGGYVQSINGDSITIRVPVRNYQDAVARVEKLGRVSHRELEAQDVTEEFVDLQARLKSAKAVRDRLAALLAKAEDVKAALAVEKELARVNEQIECLEAKLELIKNRVAYSTISATFERVYRSTPTPQLMKLPFAWLRELDPNRLMRR